MDFFLMHSINCSVFFPTFMAAPWLSAAHKTRLLEWKTRLDLALFVSRACPELRLEEVKGYVPKKRGEDAEWEGLFKRINRVEDDGHASKFVRALAQGERVCAPFEKERNGLGPTFRVSGKDWVKMGNMGMYAFHDLGMRRLMLECSS